MPQMHSPGYLRLVEAARARVPEIPAAEAHRRKLERGAHVHIVDIRPEEEWNREHVEGAERIGTSLVERDVREKLLLQSSEIIVYSGSGLRSMLVADALLRLGYRNVFSLAGGIRAWRQAGLPTVQGTGSKGT